MQKLEVFFPRILVWTPGCPQSVVEQALLDSAIAFCDETHVVQVTSDPMDVQAGTATYDLDMPIGTAISRVLNAWYGPEFFPTGAPRNIQVEPPGTISLFPVPAKDEAGLLTVRFATKPTRTAKYLDDTLLNDWVEGVVAGAVYRICVVPGHAFSDDNNAAKAMAVWRQQTNAARFEASKGRARVDTRVQPRPFA